MKKIIFLLIIACVIGVLGSLESNADQCCQFDDETCTYWDLGSWSKAEEFCTNMGFEYNFTTKFNSTSDCEHASNIIIEGCKDGWNNPNYESSSSNSNSGSRRRGNRGGYYLPNQDEDKKVDDKENSKCDPKWECGEWSACLGNTKTRSCEDISCGEETKTETQKCVIEEGKEPLEKGMGGITGWFTKNVRSKPGASAGIGLIIIILLIGLYFLMFKKSSEEEENLK